MSTAGERFSGHESFVCRYGWLPKIYKAIQQNPQLLKDEAQATHTLGIGRNMVKSIQFWAEAAGVIVNTGARGHIEGPVGAKLFGENGWDPHLESRDSLWLVHWRLSTAAGIAAWNEVFGEAKLVRFERQHLISALAQRGVGLAKPLAASTLEQHASIFIQSYYQAERSSDDTSWCPLQDLSLIKAKKAEDGRTVYSTDAAASAGLSLRVFFLALVDFVQRQGSGTWTADLGQILKGAFSPGVVFRLDEFQIRQFLDDISRSSFGKTLRFVDTADTQSVILSPEKIDRQSVLRLAEEELENA